MQCFHRAFSALANAESTENVDKVFLIPGYAALLYQFLHCTGKLHEVWQFMQPLLPLPRRIGIVDPGLKECIEADCNLRCFG